MSETQEAQSKTYRGNCHCGAFVYEATIPEIKTVYSCDCSICTKKGYLWTLVPDEAGFKVVKGDEATLTDYKFGPKERSHKFCPTCGSALFGRLPSAPQGKTMPLNVRCIQELDVWKIPVVNVHGGNEAGPYDAPKFKGHEPTFDVEPSKVYHGSCHCGAVRLAVKTHPLGKDYPETIMECNCSICQRHGNVWIYPKPEQVVIHGEENLVKYAMGQKMMSKTFCKICGVPVGNVGNELCEDEIAALTPESQQFYKQCFLFTPINVRTFNGFDLGSIEPKKFDGFNIILPKYVNP